MIRRHWRALQPASITLNFQTTEHTRLDHVRFEATSFLWATGALPGTTQIYVIRSVDGVQFIAPISRIGTLRYLRVALYYTVKQFCQPSTSVHTVHCELHLT